MEYWMFDEDDYYTDDKSDEEKEDYSPEDAIMDKYEEEMLKSLEKKAFESKPKHGKFAPAYDPNIDNIRIVQMREVGKSLREIAEQFNCSPSTVHNRLTEMGFR